MNITEYFTHRISNVTAGTIVIKEGLEEVKKVEFTGGHYVVTCKIFSHVFKYRTKDENPGLLYTMNRLGGCDRKSVFVFEEA